MEAMIIVIIIRHNIIIGKMLGLLIVETPKKEENVGSKKSGATAVFLNGNIYTVDQKFSVVKAMAVKNDKILYVGEEQIAK